MPAVEITGLTFAYRPGDPPALDDVALTVEAGERCLLVGANGAGKTTLLRVIAGRHMIARDAVRVLGRPAFHDTSLAAEVALLGGAFPFDVDVRVGDMIGSRGVDPGRRAQLIGILDVDLDWRMHHISAGQRRRVQLLMGLLRPYRVLLLDEVTSDLDVVGRADLLAFLRDESTLRGACVLYATHIFDRMEGWATHVALLQKGRLALKRPMARLEALRRLRSRGAEAPLSRLVEQWLRRPDSSVR